MIQQQQYKQRQQRQQRQHTPETVLVMQAGGSLGAYECGVYKTLARHNIWFDVISGSSIGSVNSTVTLHSADNLTPAFLPFKIRSLVSSVNTFIFGHPNALIPIWFYPGGPLLHNAFTSPYLYDTARFRKILVSR